MHLFLQRTAVTLRPSITFIKPLALSFCLAPKRAMSDLSIDLEAPNGRKYTQPLGLFINNEWVKSSDGAKIETINPS
jgi:hypothetical protein